MKITGIALSPGASLNRRRYDKDLIRRAVAQAQPLIAGGRMLMPTHHDGAQSDDSTLIVGRVTAPEVDDAGRAVYRAEPAGAPHAQTIAALCAGPSTLVRVSIRGPGGGDASGRRPGR